MASEMILLKAEANKLGIEGYRTMSGDDLRAAIKSAKGTKGASKGAVAKGTKDSTNGKVSKGKAKPAVKSKGSVSKSAPAKSKTQKSAPAKGTAAKGAAKRPATVAAPKAGKCKNHHQRKAVNTRGRYGGFCQECIDSIKGAKPAASKTSTKAGKVPAAKGAASKGAAKSKRGQVTGRASINLKDVDWKAESNVGRSGKRAEVLKALRKLKSYDKVFDLLKPNAKKWYPQHDKHGAERMLRWLINRVAFDFVLKTGQHQMGTRAAYGTSKKAVDTRRREQREKAGKAAKRGTSKKVAAPAKGKAAPKRGRPPGSKNKPPVAKAKGAGKKSGAKGSTRKGVAKKGR